MDFTHAQLIKNNTAHFAYYRNQHVYYTIVYQGTTYQFPVTVDPTDPAYDLGNATLNAVEKGMTMLRYIRLAQESGTFTKVA